jgi:hypothetical protein
LVAAGALDEGVARRALWEAGELNGVALERESEVRRAIERGLAKGVGDGAYDFAVPRTRLVAELEAPRTVAI